METKRWAEDGDLKPCILRSRRRTGWCGFSARLLARRSCSCRPENPIVCSSEFVSDDDGRREALPLQQFPEQLHRGGLVAPRLDHDVEHFAFAVDRPPHVHPPACDRDDHLIEMPLTLWCRSPAPKVARDSRPELQHPSSDSLVTDLQTALRQQILDITVAQGEAQVEPDRVPDDNGRIAVAGV